MSVEEAWSTICEVKRLKEAEQREIKSQLEACLERVGGVRKLWKNVEEMRVVQYNQEDHTHEELLMKVCYKWVCACHVMVGVSVLVVGQP